MSATTNTPADDVQTRFSLHHTLIMLHGDAITRLLSGEDRQDTTLTELEAAVAELSGLVDRLAQIERRVADVEARS